MLMSRRRNRSSPSLSALAASAPQVLDERLRSDSGSGRIENYSFRAMAQDQVDVIHHYRHERLLVTAHDRGARVAHRLCLDHPERVCLMDIADVLKRELRPDVRRFTCRAQMTIGTRPRGSRGCWDRADAGERCGVVG
jgi:pimeloyl-ACP methyl ester carboxylesterase